MFPGVFEKRSAGVNVSHDKRSEPNCVDADASASLSQHNSGNMSKHLEKSNFSVREECAEMFPGVFEKRFAGVPLGFIQISYNWAVS